MQKKTVVMALLVVGMMFAGVVAYAQGGCGSCGNAGGGYGAAKGWGSDPANDPVYKQFLDDTAELRKAIAMDRAELNALMVSENPDKEEAKMIAGRMVENQQKLAALKSENGFGGPGAGGCGSCGGGGRGYRGGCGGPNAYGGGSGGGYCGGAGCGGPGAGPRFNR